ncbi:MAG: pentapeptide repeat-containing protein, partial [Cyanobacteria bacterium J06588_5]
YCHCNRYARQRPMQAQTVLKLYEDGRRDFTGLSLAGADFSAQILVDIDFSDSDLTGAVAVAKLRTHQKKDYYS